MRERLLFFDVLRIIAVLLMVIHHLPGFPVASLYSFLYNNGTALTYHITSGPLAVYLLVFISGAVLEYSYQNKDTLKNYWNFVLKRLERIYPSYWVALIICSMIAPTFLLNKQYLVAQFLGFMPSPSYYSWWIGLFISLYLLFPIISKGIKKFPYETLLTLFVITIISRLLLSGIVSPFLGFPLPLFQADRVFFPCFLFEFSLGIFIIRKSYFPKLENKNKFLILTSDLSYYVFLIHTPIRQFLYGQTPSLVWQPRNFAYYFLMVMLFSTLLMAFDEKIQKFFKTIRTSNSSKKPV